MTYTKQIWENFPSTTTPITAGRLQHIEDGIYDADALAASALALAGTKADASHNHAGTYQPVDADLTAIGALAGTEGILKKTAANTWTLDTVSYAPLGSPTFTGVPAAPTAAPGTNTTQIATTAFVKAAVDGIIDSAPGTLDTLNELAAALGDDANFASTVTNSLALKAPLASPTFTGVPAAPTAAVNTNTTQVATTAFVQTALSSASASPQDSNLIIGLAVFS